MRLIKSNNNYYYIDNGKVIKSNGENSTTDEDKKTLSYLSKFSISSYKDLLNIIKRQSDRKLPTHLYCQIYNDEYLVIIKSEMGELPKFMVSYKIENDTIKEFIKKLLNISGEEYADILMDKHNKYNFIVCDPILEVLFENANLKAQGIPAFNHFKIPKKNSNKLREIIAPHDNIKKPLKKLNYLLQNTYDSRNEEFQIAYKKGKSIHDNAKIHTEYKYMMTSDLKDFFPSCKRELVDNYIKFLFKNSYNQINVKNMFLDIILHNDGLFIGNPISGTISSAILSEAVSYIKSICGNFGMSFSVYADDMTFGSDRYISKKVVKSIFRTAFETYGLSEYFTLNEEKFRGHSGCHRRTVGLSINDSNKITIPNVRYREVRSRLHHLHYQTGLKGGNLQELKGIIAYMTAYDDSGKVYRLLKKYKDDVKKYSICSDKIMSKLAERFEANV